MLNSMRKTYHNAWMAVVTTMALFSLTSCLPTETPPSLDNGNLTDGTNTTNTYGEPSYPLSGIFIQEGAIQSATNLSVPVSFSDSFLVRGEVLSKYLRKLPNTTKFCMVGKYNYTAGFDKFLILSAKPSSYTDLAAKTTEFYLKVEPANDVSNQNDCSTINLTNALYLNASSPSASYSFNQLCSNCSTAATSTALKLFFINGEEVPNLSFRNLTLTLSGNSSSTVNSCSSTAACTARGYNCCLDSQCVNDGALKPSASSLPGFAAAQEDVRLNPARFLLYPQFYFVCENRPETTTSGSGSGGNPDYEAAVRVKELTHRYNCLNQVDGEFSYCTIKFTDASERIPGVFSGTTLGFYDDVNFSTINTNLGTGDYKNNIVKVDYAGKILYEFKSTSLNDAAFTASTHNDTLTNVQSVSVTSALPSNALDDNLYVTYKVDGTCEKIGATLGKCTKTYIQSSSDTFSTKWHDSSKIFLLPTYADLTSNVVVKIGGTTVPEDASTWSKSTSPNKITFSSSYLLYQNQEIQITYFVSGTSNVSALLKMKTAIQTEVNSMCRCLTSQKCNLKPVYNETNSLVNYSCVYPSNEPSIPSTQTVAVTSKNLPHRYYDTNGVNYDESITGALPQELTAFGYTGNNVLRPNNASSYVGFNEINGSFKADSGSARAAKKVSVKKDAYYDIYADSGAFSGCQTCGSDYYSSLQKIFPQNFVGVGGGYSPDKYESRRESSTSIYRSDDLAYGRACFVPATMLPWTHVAGTTIQTQRTNRLNGQHFLFANGYNRDWYGFDYGSLIGSFDGVTWFSIGNQRRVKASTGKLFLAVNAYYGDLNVDNGFSVTISENANNTTTIPTHDTASDGAECQKSHYCSTDNDCFRQLGYDYACQSVSGLTTAWPTFDPLGSETIGSTTKTLASIVGGTNNVPNRCVYRGRGAPCLNDLTSLASGTLATFNGSVNVGTLTCSNNNYCQTISSSTNRFNNRIARFASSPLTQNLATAASTPSDIAGLGARILGRPFDYYGTQVPPTGSTTNLSTNLVNAICVPGKDIVNSTRVFQLNSRSPSSRVESSDKIMGVGPTMSGTAANSKYLNACPATNELGKSMQNFDLSITDTLVSQFAINQNISSNLLDLAPLNALNIYSSTADSQISAVGYQRNTCLRAPGASCFSDFECAASPNIATKVKSADLSALLNTAEEKFWEEELTCGNPDFKYVSPNNLNPNYDIKKNVCCREMGKTMTVYTQSDTSTHHWCDTATNTIKVAGVTTTTSASSRYSRVHTGYDKMTCDPSAISSTKTFALSVAAPSSTVRMQQILNQYKTLDTVNQRTCCTQNWVRSFATENGGGHKFSRTKMQTLDKEVFKNISWNTQNSTIITDTDFECNADNYANSSCEIRSLTATEEDKYLTWAGSLELLGIPQVAVKTNDEIFQLVDDTQITNAVSKLPLAVVKSGVSTPIMTALAGNEDFYDASASESYYSAASYSKFDMTTGGLKKVFSENEFNCCIPTNKEVPSNTTADQCCTGSLANVNGPLRCCLPDFTDVTVYLNRYVSSEGRGLPDSSYDPKTGYIKDPAQVKILVAQKNLCCSGTAMTGVAVSQLSIPIEGGGYKPASQLSTTRRFTYRSDAVDNNAETGSVGSIFDAGVKWNNHVYCVPAGFGQ